MRAEARVRVDLLVAPAAHRPAGREGYAGGGDERVADDVAGGASLGLGAPDELQRVPAQAALPGDVDGGGRVAAVLEAFVPIAGERERSPPPAHQPHAAVQLVGDLAEE